MGGDPGGKNAPYMDFVELMERIEARRGNPMADFEVEVVETRELDWRNIIDEGT